MKLHYRGATYDHADLPVETVDAPVVGHYRGATHKIHQPKQRVAQPPTQRLKYRGAWVQN
jgi:hypothetical protein